MADEKDILKQQEIKFIENLDEINLSVSSNKQINNFKDIIIVFDTDS